MGDFLGCVPDGEGDDEGDDGDDGDDEGGGEEDVLLFPWFRCKMRAVLTRHGEDRCSTVVAQSALLLVVFKIAFMQQFSLLFTHSQMNLKKDWRQYF